MRFEPFAVKCGRVIFRPQLKQRRRLTVRRKVFARRVKRSIRLRIRLVYISNPIIGPNERHNVRVIAFELIVIPRRPDICREIILRIVYAPVQRQRCIRSLAFVHLGQRRIFRHVNLPRNIVVAISLLYHHPHVILKRLKLTLRLLRNGFVILQHSNVIRQLLIRVLRVARNATAVVIADLAVVNFLLQVVDRALRDAARQVNIVVLLQVVNDVVVRRAGIWVVVRHARVGNRSVERIPEIDRVHALLLLFHSVRFRFVCLEHVV